ncbi:MAG: hypothetical protein NW226_20260 [Microscillaceae bacterium]|nr:hypothetical protein [Microscillaceae bacterium]
MNLSKKIFYVVGLWLMTWGLVEAQINNFNDATGTPIREKKYSDIQGSPYLNDQWISGSLIFNKDEIQTNVPLRYNAYEDKIEFQQNGGTFVFDNASILGCDMYVLDPGTQKLKRYAIRNGFSGLEGYGFGEKDFFIVTYQNKIAFITKLKASLTETTATYGEKATSKIFVQSEKSYLIKEDGKVTQINRSNGAVIKSLGQSSLKEFVKKEKLNVKDDGDLAKLLREYEVRFLNETNVKTE